MPQVPYDNPEQAPPDKRSASYTPRIGGKASVGRATVVAKRPVPERGKREMQQQQLLGPHPRIGVPKREPRGPREYSGVHNQPSYEGLGFMDKYKPMAKMPYARRKIQGRATVRTSSRFGGR